MSEAIEPLRFLVLEVIGRNEVIDFGGVVAAKRSRIEACDRSDRRALEPVLGQLAEAMAEVFRSGQPALAEAFARTNLSTQDERFEELLHYLYAAAARLARERLEAEGLLPDWPEHRDGSRWVWWAEEPPETEVE